MNNAHLTGPGTAETSIQTKGTMERQSAGSAVLGLAVMLSAGVALAFLCNRLYLNHPTGQLFRFLVSIPLAFVGALLLHRFAFARRHVLAFAGLGASVAVLSMHYLDYRDFPRQLEPRLRDVLAAQAIRDLLADHKEQGRKTEEVLAEFPPETRTRLPAEKQKRLEQAPAQLAELRRLDSELEALARRLADPKKEQEMEPVFRRFGAAFAGVRERFKAEGVHGAFGDRHTAAEPIVGPWINTLGLGGYLTLRAEQGVTVNFFGTKILLNQTASYLYWVVEVLAAGLATALLMRKAARDKDLKDLLAPGQPS